MNLYRIGISVCPDQMPKLVFQRSESSFQLKFLQANVLGRKAITAFKAR